MNRIIIPVVFIGVGIAVLVTGGLIAKEGLPSFDWETGMQTGSYAQVVTGLVIAAVGGLLATIGVVAEGVLLGLRAHVAALVDETADEEDVTSHVDATPYSGKHSV